MTLSEYRDQHGLTLRQMADALGCVPSTVMRIEKGTTQPKLSLIRKIVTVTDRAVTLDDLFPAE